MLEAVPQKTQWSWIVIVSPQDSVTVCPKGVDNNQTTAMSSWWYPNWWTGQDPWSGGNDPWTKRRATSSAGSTRCDDDDDDDELQRPIQVGAVRLVEKEKTGRWRSWWKSWYEKEDSPRYNEDDDPRWEYEDESMDAKKRSYEGPCRYYNDWEAWIFQLK